MQKDAFLQRAGWENSRREPLAGDASARRYDRLSRGGESAILMSAPPETGLSLHPFIEVTRWLRNGGISAPALLAANPEQGFLLLEDFGGDLFMKLCRQPSVERELYAAAVDALAAVQRLEPPTAGPVWRPQPYDMSVLLREAWLLIEWYLPAATDQETDFALATSYDATAEAAFASVTEGRRVAVLRDYHSENLVWLPARDGVARVGMLDYQDMVLGHPAYDLASLLEDARRDTAPELRHSMIARYLDRTGRDAEDFVRAMHVLGAQRNLKILGLFTRLARRDGKPRYLAHLPRVWEHLMRDVAHPALAELRQWIERHVPRPDAVVLARLARRRA